MKKRKLVFLIKDYRGGMCTFLYQLNQINKARFVIRNVYLQNEGIAESVPGGAFLNIGYPKESYFSIVKTLKFFKILVKLLFFIKKEKPDVLVGFVNYSMMVSAIIKKLLGNKIFNVVIVNNNTLEIFRRRKPDIYKKTLGWVFAYLIEAPDLVIFTSSEMARDYSNKFSLDKSKVIVTPNSVDLKLATRLQKSKLTASDLKKLVSKKKGSFNIVSFGRMEEQKDFITLVDAYNIFQKICPNSKLILIGDGPDRKKIEKHLKKKKIFNKAVFLGWKNNIYKYLKYADLFVFSSKYEGFGMVIVEAMAVGVPVIATDTPYGPREILQNGKYGVLVPVGDSKTMSAQIEKLWRDKKLRRSLSQRGIKRAKEFDSRKMIEHYEKMFSI